MEGAAYAWYKWVMKNALMQTWPEFLNALLLRFGTSLYDDPKAALKELRQNSTVTEYQTQFEEISTKVTGLSEQWLVSFFIAKLQDQLKCELLLAQPTSYYQVVSLAKLHEHTIKHSPNKLTSATTTVSKPNSFSSAYIQPDFKSTSQAHYIAKPNQQNTLNTNSD